MLCLVALEVFMASHTKDFYNALAHIKRTALATQTRTEVEKTQKFLFLRLNNTQLVFRDCRYLSDSFIKILS